MSCVLTGSCCLELWGTSGGWALAERDRWSRCFSQRQINYQVVSPSSQRHSSSSLTFPLQLPSMDTKTEASLRGHAGTPSIFQKGLLGPPAKTCWHGTSLPTLSTVCRKEKKQLLPIASRKANKIGMGCLGRLQALPVSEGRIPHCMSSALPNLLRVFQVFHNCSCLEASSSWTGDNSATLGQCPKSEDCSRRFIYYTVIQVISGFCYALGGTPAYMIMFR